MAEINLHYAYPLLIGPPRQGPALALHVDDPRETANQHAGGPRGFHAVSPRETSTRDGCS